MANIVVEKITSLNTNPETSNNQSIALIVDDEPMNIEVLKTMLEAEGVASDTALSGR